MEPEKEENSEVVRIYNQFMKGVTTERVLKELSSESLLSLCILSILATTE
jgi:hypothetical protein